MQDLSQADRTVSQNQRLNLGSVWTRKYIAFILEMYDLSQADRTVVRLAQSSVELCRMTQTGKE